jgi:PAS domain S-box-containing protein
LIDRDGDDGLGKRFNQALLAVLEAGGDGLVVIDGRGDIVLVNSRTERMFGYDQDELIGQPVEALVPPAYAKRHASDRTEYIRHPGTRPMGRGMDLWARRKDGTQFPVEISLVPLQVEQRLFVAAMIRDLVDVVVLGKRLMQLLSDVGNELGSFIGSRRGPVDRSLLTARELEVLGLVAQGLTAREISTRLTVSPSTVKTHLEHIYDKLGASDRAAAVARAMRAGIMH